MKSAFELACDEPWAITRPKLEAILEIARHKELDLDALEAAQGALLRGKTQIARNDAGVVTIDVIGPMFRYANLLTKISGATSIELLMKEFSAAAADDYVKGIILRMDSPGGTVSGTNELAKMIYAARKPGRPIIAYVDGDAASAAYWVASAADRILTDEVGLLGSIGVIATVITDRNKKEVQFISSQSPLKRPDPMSDTGRAAMQKLVDDLAREFIDVVARNRGVDAERVMRDFGQGFVMKGVDAVAAGMADGISSYQEILASLAAGEVPAGMQPASHMKGHSMDKVTAATVAAEHPEVASALRAEGEKVGFDRGKAAGHAEGLGEGKRTGFEEGRKAGRDEGRQDEQNRRAGLRAQAMPGFEKELAEAEADGKSTGADLAMRINAVIRERGADYIKRLQADAAALPAIQPAASATGQPQAAAAAGVDETDPAAIKAADEALWAKDANLRREFGSKETFVAYRDAERKGAIVRTYNRPAA